MKNFANIFMNKVPFYIIEKVMIEVKLIMFGIITIFSLSFVIISCKKPSGFLVQKKINASKGGTLSTPDGVLTLVIPPNALNKNTTITIFLSNRSLPSFLLEFVTPLTDCYNIDIGDAQLEDSVILKMKCRSFPTLSVCLAYYNDFLKNWEFIGGKIDTVEKSITVKTLHLSDWQGVNIQRCPAPFYYLPTEGWLGRRFNERVGRGKKFNGIDIWTSNPLSEDRDRSPGNPVYLPYPGKLIGFFKRRLDPHRGTVQGIRFEHHIDSSWQNVVPYLKIETWYIGMADESTGKSLLSKEFVDENGNERLDRIGITYPAGTFLGYQGNQRFESHKEDIRTHLHFAIYCPLRVHEFVDPSPYIGYNVNAEALNVLPNLIFLYLPKLSSPPYNTSPNVPQTPFGPSNGEIDSFYTFTTLTTDPDGDSVSYQFDWEDGSLSEWSPFVPSGTSISVAKSWANSGTYCIKVRAKDRKGGVSDWSEGHEIIISDGGSGWIKTFGCSYSDFGYSVQQTSDGGYIIVGSTYSFSSRTFYSDVYLIKTDNRGNLEWSKTFGGSRWEFGYSVRQTSDGGYIIVGVTNSFGAGEGDVYLIKTDYKGNLEWSKTFGGFQWEYGYSVEQTLDGGYIIAGETYTFGTGGPGNGNVYLIKTDSRGKLEWSKTFGGFDLERGYSVQQTSDGGYIITGQIQYSYIEDMSNVYLIKTDNRGNLEWSKTFGGSGWDYGYSVQQTSDGGYIIVGSTSSFGAGADDVYLIKTDNRGNLEWSKTFGGSGRDYGYSVQQTSDGGYIIVGSTSSFGAGADDVYLIKTDESGNLEWSKTFGGSCSDCGYSVQQTSEGGYIIVGSTSSFGAGGSDVYLIKTDARGNPFAR